MCRGRCPKAGCVGQNEGNWAGKEPPKSDGVRKEGGIQDEGIAAGEEASAWNWWSGSGKVCLEGCIRSWGYGKQGTLP